MNALTKFNGYPSSNFTESHGNQPHSGVREEKLKESLFYYDMWSVNHEYLSLINGNFYLLVVLDKSREMAKSYEDSSTDHHGFHGNPPSSC